MGGSSIIIKPSKLAGVFEISLSPQIDHRGHFMRTYDQGMFEDHGLHQQWVQENHSLTQKKGTVRGLHWQSHPYTETKLISVLKGTIFDVFVDLRKNSPTFGKWDALELRESDYKLLYLPKGFAHGFCTLTDNCEVVYKVDNFYSPAHERGILWNDKTLRIDWPISKPIISDKDKILPTFKSFLPYSYF